MSFNNEPLYQLPKDLQKRKRKIEEKLKASQDELNKINMLIKEYRHTCKHEPIPGTQDNYAVYSRHCGEMIDTWL